MWDAHGEWIIPGLLSAHSHLWQAAFRGIAQDQTLPGWIDGLYNQHALYAKAEDYYWFTLYGALDHLEHGVTGAYDFAYGGTSSRNRARATNAMRNRFVARWIPAFALCMAMTPT